MAKLASLSTKKLLLGYWLLLLAYSVWSYSLTDPNLVISQNVWYWQFQQWMWMNFFQNKQLLVGSYLTIIFGLFLVFRLLIKAITNEREAELRVISGSSLRTRVERLLKHPVVTYLLIISPLLLSYNALSHDVFNYMFNAKMVHTYMADPHVHVALEYPNDLWVRFMHNTHTPAPYGYGWTVFSLLPSALGFGRFISTWLMFRLFNVVAVLLLYVVTKLAMKSFFNKELTLEKALPVFLNPLFLIEVIGNIHNDLWMLIPAVASFVLLSRVVHPAYARIKSLLIAASLALLLISVSVKLVTIVLIPLWILERLSQMQIMTLIQALSSRIRLPDRYTEVMASGISLKVQQLVPLLASLALFLPLFTSRSQQFLPWYLLWSLVWLPLCNWKWWKQLVFVLSLSSLLRYVPVLYAGQNTAEVFSHERLITWAIPLLFIVHSFSIKTQKSSVLNLKRIE